MIIIDMMAGSDGSAISIMSFNYVIIFDMMAGSDGSAISNMSINK